MRSAEPGAGVRWEARQRHRPAGGPLEQVLDEVTQGATMTMSMPTSRAAQAATRVEPLAEGVEAEEFVLTLITSRRNVAPKRLCAPGPTPQQLQSMLQAAAAAPDHGLLTPWRFIIVPVDKRHLLAEAFALALVDRDPGATPDQIESAREKAHRAPLLMVAVACLERREPDVPVLERMVSMGAAIQNLLLAAHAMGYGTGLTSGRAMDSLRLRELLSLGDGEHAVCCVNVGRVAKAKAARIRPMPERFCSVL
jgi:nitroreductase